MVQAGWLLVVASKLHPYHDICCPRAESFDLKWQRLVPWRCLVPGAGDRFAAGRGPLFLALCSVSVSCGSWLVLLSL